MKKKKTLYLMLLLLILIIKPLGLLASSNATIEFQKQQKIAETYYADMIKKIKLPEEKGGEGFTEDLAEEQVSNGIYTYPQFDFPNQKKPTFFGSTVSGFPITTFKLREDPVAVWETNVPNDLYLTVANTSLINDTRYPILESLVRSQGNSDRNAHGVFLDMIQLYMHPSDRLEAPPYNMAYNGRYRNVYYTTSASNQIPYRGFMYVDQNKDGSWPDKPSDFRIVEKYDSKGLGRGGNGSNWDGTDFSPKGYGAEHLLKAYTHKRMRVLRNPRTSELMYTFITEDNSRIMKLRAKPIPETKRLELKNEMISLQNGLTTMLLTQAVFDKHSSYMTDGYNYQQYTMDARGSDNRHRGVYYKDTGDNKENSLNTEVFINYDLRDPEGPTNVGIEYHEGSSNYSYKIADATNFFDPFNKQALGEGMEAWNNGKGPEPETKIPTDEFISSVGYGGYDFTSALNMKGSPVTLNFGESSSLKYYLSYKTPQLGPRVMFSSREVDLSKNQDFETTLKWYDESPGSTGGKMEAFIDDEIVWQSTYTKKLGDTQATGSRKVKIPSDKFKKDYGKTTPVKFVITNNLNVNDFASYERIGQETVIVRNVREIPIRYEDDHGNIIDSMPKETTNKVVGIDGEKVKFKVPKEIDKPTYELQNVYPDNLLSLDILPSYGEVILTIGALLEEPDSLATIVYKSNFMGMKLTPSSIDVYPDQITDKIHYTYNISEIPESDGFGEVMFTYPQDVKDTSVKFSTDESKSSQGEYQIKPKLLIDNIDYTMGTKTPYDITTQAIYQKEGNMKGLKTRKTPFTLNLYNLGATPVVQKLNVNDTFTKTPESIIQNPVILPNHQAIYEYVKSDGTTTTDPSELEIDTSKETGASPLIVQVKMTDTDPSENGRFAIINVPIIVGEVNKDRLILSADDFDISYEEFQKVNEKQIDYLILEKSKAVAIDPNNTSVEGIHLSVAETTLKKDSKEGETYTAKIRAEKKGFPIEEKIITINLLSGLTAEVVPQEIPIGKQLTVDDLNGFVTNVQVNGKTLGKDEYLTNLSSKNTLPDVVTSEGETQKISVEVSPKANPKSKNIFEVPVTMIWGNSIVFGGDETGGRAGGGAYSVHGDNAPYISSVSGAVVSNDQEMISKNHSQEYLTMSWYDLSKTVETFTINSQTVSDFEIKGKGTDRKQAVLDQWQKDGNNLVNVNYGDIVRGWSLEPEKQYISRNNKLTEYDDIHQEIFYEVIKNQEGTASYRRLVFNHSEAMGVGKNNHVPVVYNTSEEELKKNVANYVKLPTTNNELRVVGFKEGHLPKLDKPGDTSESIIIVEETLQTKKRKVQYELKVVFEAINGSLGFISADDLAFGTQKNPLQDSYFRLDSPEYKIEVNDTRYKDTVKPWQLEAKVEAPLHYTINDHQKDLEGSSIIKYKGNNNKVIGTSSESIYTNTDKEAGKKTIVWDKNSEEGYLLFVKGNSADKGRRYKTTMLYSISDIPTSKPIKKE